MESWVICIKPVLSYIFQNHLKTFEMSHGLGHDYFEKVSWVEPCKNLMGCAMIDFEKGSMG